MFNFSIMNFFKVNQQPQNMFHHHLKLRDIRLEFRQQRHLNPNTMMFHMHLNIKLSKTVATKMFNAESLTIPSIYKCDGSLTALF